MALTLRIGRTMTHSEMRDVCNSLTRRNPDGVLLQLLGKSPSVQLQALCLTFVELQNARHAADYDLSDNLTRSDAERYISETEVAFAAWQGIRNTHEVTVFLAALLFSKRWSR